MKTKRKTKNGNFYLTKIFLLKLRPRKSIASN